MKTVIYGFVDGTVNEVEVSDELYAVIAKIERKTKNNDRRETRRHVSLDLLVGRSDTEIADKSVNIETAFIKRGNIKKLRAAMKTLTPEQKKLVQKVFFERKTLKVIAEECGASYQALQNRLRKIYKKLRKYF